MTPGSDLDLVVHHPHLTPFAILSTLTRHVRHPRISKRGQVRYISRARVPIVKFQDARYGIDIDVSANQSDGHASSDVCLGYLNEFPLLRPLVLLIKHWLASHDWHRVYQGGLGSYAVRFLIVDL
jgi:non-canonical poly(A) RNA polymerase PAPD5/7